MSDTETFDADLRRLLQNIEDENHADENFVFEVGRIIQVFRRNARKNSLGMRDAIAQILGPDRRAPTNGHAPDFTDKVYVGNGTGGDPFEAIQNMAKQGIN